MIFKRLGIKWNNPSRSNLRSNHLHPLPCVPESPGWDFLSDPVSSPSWKRKLLSRVRLFANPWTIQSGILQARILEWVAFSFSRGSSHPRDWTQVSHIAGEFFTSWATKSLHGLVYFSYSLPFLPILNLKRRGRWKYVRIYMDSTMDSTLSAYVIIIFYVNRIFIDLSVIT